MNKQKPTRRERSELQTQSPQKKPDSTFNSGLFPEERRHLKFGWWSLFVFVCLGILLETFLAFRIGWYMNSGDNETHRLMLRLGHAHGTFLSLVNIAYAATLSRINLIEKLLEAAKGVCGAGRACFEARQCKENVGKCLCGGRESLHSCKDM